MYCHACEITLEHDDNYCRKCGAPARVLDLVAAPAQRDVVYVGPSAPALLTTIARPLATGMAAVAAGALLRFAIRRTLRALANEGGRRAAPTERQPAAPAAPGVTEIVEVFWYRRIVRS